MPQEELLPEVALLPCVLLQHLPAGVQFLDNMVKVICYRFCSNLGSPHILLQFSSWFLGWAGQHGCESWSLAEESRQPGPSSLPPCAPRWSAAIPGPPPSLRSPLAQGTRREPVSCASAAHMSGCTYAFPCPPLSNIRVRHFKCSLE